MWLYGGMDTITTSLRMPRTLRNRIRAAADNEGRSLTNWILRACLKVLDADQ